MNAADVLEGLRTHLPGLAQHPPDTAWQATVEPGTLREHLRLLRDELAFDFLVFVTALDRPAEPAIELVYRLFSYQTGLTVVLRVLLPRTGARVDTVSDIYRTAEWHERETAEMFGVDFAGHPDPRKLLVPDDVDGHPLRKDFSHPNMIRLPEAQ